MYKSINILFASIAVAVLLSACGGMYDSLEEYAGEIVYPAKFDTVVGHIGFERVEIDLMKAGRIPSSAIKLGKAKKTVVEYDTVQLVIDSLVSWVNITGLNRSKLYRFHIYTLDEYGNKSVPQEIALIPYTSSDVEALAIASPRILASPSSAVVDWPNGLSSVLLTYYGLNYRYTDKDGTVRSGERGADARFFVANLEPGQTATIDVTYRVVPRVNNEPIIDTISLERQLEITMPTANTPFSPAEPAILQANGVSVFTANGVADITKLVYPVHANSIQDIFYFPNLNELDLTGGNLFNMTTLRYNRNGVDKTVGGGPWVPFARKVDNLPAADAQTLKDLLEAGLLTKVRYVPNTMGLDDVLAPYVESGVVELVPPPAEAPISLDYLVDGLVQDNAWAMGLDVPATEYPAGTGLQNVIKTELRARSASFVFALPVEYRFNVEEYRYLKFKVYAPAKEVFAGAYAPYQRLWPRFMNYMWAFSHHSNFGQEYWAPNADDFRIADGDLGKWIDVTVDLASARGRHNRVIVMNVGGEPSVDFQPPSPIVYYFANFRFTKE